jgi:N-acetylmuramoyl-L-alanine amidase
MLPIKRLFLTNKNRPKKKIRKLKGIVVHWTANEGKGANALANRNYFNNTTRAASAHYIVDDHQIIQCIPDDEIAYHVGAKKYRTDGIKLSESPYGPNYFLIGIEMCVNKDGVWSKTYQNTIDLIVYLLKKHSLTVDDLYRHYDITGKDCPRMMIDEKDWNSFKIDISVKLKNEQSKTPELENKEPKDVKGVSIIKIPVLNRFIRLKSPLMEGQDVKKLQERLKELGYGVGSVDGIYGEETVNAVKQFQKDLKLVEDGIVGAITWRTIFDSNTKLKDVKYSSKIEVLELKRVLKLSDPMMKGEDVKILQMKLKDLGYEPGDVDGILGKMTINAVKKFQQDNKLVVDGIVGSNTWKTLFK